MYFWYFWSFLTLNSNVISDVRIYCEEASISHTYELAIQNKDSGYCKYYCYLMIFL